MVAWVLKRQVGELPKHWLRLAHGDVHSLWMQIEACASHAHLQHGVCAANELYPNCELLHLVMHRGLLRREMTARILACFSLIRELRTLSLTP